MAKRRPKKTAPNPALATKRIPWELSFSDPYGWMPWIFGLLALVAGVFAFDSRLGLSGDNAEFIILGRSVAEGHGLTYIHSLDMRPATKYPFGFPMLLAIVHTIAPNSVLGMKVFVLLCFVAAIPLVYRYVLRDNSLLITVLVTIASLTCHFVVDYSHQIMSEIPYLLVSMIALFALEAAVRSRTHRDIAFAVVAVMAVYYVRSVGMSLIAGGTAYFLLHRHYREGGLFFTGCVLLALPYQIRTSMLGGESYAKTWLFRVDPYRADAGEIGWLGLADRVIENAKVYALRELPIALIPAWISNQIPIILGLAASALIVYFIITQILNRKLAGVYLMFYLGACFLWPIVWTDVRLLAPVLPIVFLGIISSCHTILARFSNKTLAGAVATAIALAIIVPNTQAVAALAGQEHRYPPSWSTYFEAARWIDENTEPNVIVACRKAYLMAVISNRKTTSYALTEDVNAVLTSLEDGKADIIVVDQLGFNSTSRYLVPAIVRHKDRFEFVHVVTDPDTYILRLRP